jgi:hypothetical protein
MNRKAQDIRFLRFALLGWLILEALVVAVVGIRDNAPLPELLIIAAGLVTMTLFAALVTYLVARLMNLL